MLGRLIIASLSDDAQCHMRFLCLFLSALILVGCGGASSSLASHPYTGSWTGTWVNISDPADAGTSEWTVDSSGLIDGHDFDPGRTTTFHVVGNITESGALTSNSTPAGGSPATLDGQMRFSSANHISGTLAWGVSPVLSYRYTFIRN